MLSLLCRASYTHRFSKWVVGCKHGSSLELLPYVTSTLWKHSQARDLDVFVDQMTAKDITDIQPSQC